MKIYNIKVNGKVYEVEVEVKENEGSIDKKTNKDNKTNGCFELKAPMQGSVVSIKVNEGDEISTKTPIVILEAMKMENEVFSEVNGKVKKVLVSEGKAVNNGEVLVLIEEMK